MKYRNFYTCCFTGHRPSGFPWGYNENSFECFKFKWRLKRIIEGAIKFGCNYFICGMALGFDMICAEIVLKLRKKYPNIKIEAALPCRNQYVRWKDEDIKRYSRLLFQMDKVVCLNEEYTLSCMNERNKYMIEKSDIVIACWNGSFSGTYNTLKMAKEKGCRIKLIRI